jgi:SAM-dependent methyltransferase
VTVFHYAGSELDLFALAKNWKSYWSGRIAGYISGDVLEVGAGIGSNTRVMRRCARGRWVCLEPDADLAAQLHENTGGVEGAERVESVCGTLSSLDASERFDAIVYIDVLEHIEDDAGEIQLAASRLRAGGRIIVLSPAHQFLFTAFDQSIGHFRRYDRRSLRRITPPGLHTEALFYLDACGILANGANQLLLRQSMPTQAQIAFWDRWIVSASRALDPLLGYSVGKSIIAVWRKPLSPGAAPAE